MLRIIKRKMASLTLAEKRRIYHSLSQSKKNSLEKMCCSAHMQGEGFMDIVRKAGKFLGPIAKVIGPIVLKEIIVPLIKQKMGGKGVKLAGKGVKLAGKGVKLAGKGKKKKPKKKVKK